uniref:Uncharacterized protein n=1 Tax=Malurus cyaneus samueli TaxID=2593467 RepID=A0A8C5UFC1_9PASS
PSLVPCLGCHALLWVCLSAHGTEKPVALPEPTRSTSPITHPPTCSPAKTQAPGLISKPSFIAELKWESGRAHKSMKMTQNTGTVTLEVLYFELQSERGDALPLQVDEKSQN